VTQIDISNNKGSFRIDLKQFQHSIDFKIIINFAALFLIKSNLAIMLFG